MSVTETETPTKVPAVVVEADDAPLWMPRHDQTAIDHASVQSADAVEGYSWRSRLTAALFGTRSKTATSIATLVAILAFLASAPVFLSGGLANVIKVAFYQSWTLGIMLTASARVRTISLGTVIRYWLVGLFSVVMFVYFVTGPLSSVLGVDEGRSVWIIPVLEELTKALPLVGAVLVGRRMWRHPGLSDLMILGFAIGGGYAFYEDVLWERAALSGLEANAGLFVPTIYQPDGVFAIGHAGWTAIVGLCIGAAILYRRYAPVIVAAGFGLFAVVVDHMAINDRNGPLDWARQLLFNGKLLAVVLIVGAVAAVVLDRRRLDTMAGRDHLFSNSDPQPHIGGVEPHDEFIRQRIGARYRRLRNGVHTTFGSSSQQWPTIAEEPTAPVAELARLARSAGIDVGPGTAPTGWAPDPGRGNGERFVGPSGWTPYVSVDNEPSTSTTRSRPDAIAVEAYRPGDDYWQLAAVAVVALVVLVALRLFTAGDPSTAGIEFSLEALGMPASLPDAPNRPGVIRGVFGGLAAVVAAAGRGRPVLELGSFSGPGDDPTPDRPHECEA